MEPHRSRPTAACTPRGRTVLLCGVVVFVALQFAASVALDYGWPQVRYPVFYQSLGRLDSWPRSPNVVLLGSSRTGHLLNEAEVNRALRDATGDPAVECYNACVLGGDVVVAERMFHQLLGRGVAPRALLIEVTPEEVCRRNGWLRQYHFMLLRWDDVPGYLAELGRTHDLPRFIGMRCAPLYYFRDPLRKEIGRHFAALHEAPPAEQTGQPAHVPERTTMRDIHDLPRWFRDYAVGGNSAAALERLLGQCRARGIEAILYSPPLSSAHRGFYTSEIESAFQAYMAAVTQEYGCRYVDYRTLLADTYFIDHHHCGPEAMPLFSRKVALEVLAPAWKR
jgi:hypothetical protein